MNNPEPECPDCGGNLYEGIMKGGSLLIKCDECPYYAYWSTEEWFDTLEELNQDTQSDQEESDDEPSPQQPSQRTNSLDPHQVVSLALEEMLGELVEASEEVVGRSKRALLLLKSLSLVEDKSKHTPYSEGMTEQKPEG